MGKIHAKGLSLCWPEGSGPYVPEQRWRAVAAWSCSDCSLKKGPESTSLSIGLCKIRRILKRTSSSPSLSDILALYLPFFPKCLPLQQVFLIYLLLLQSQGSKNCLHQISGCLSSAFFSRQSIRNTFVGKILKLHILGKLAGDAESFILKFRDVKLKMASFCHLNEYFSM